MLLDPISRIDTASRRTVPSTGFADSQDDMRARSLVRANNPTNVSRRGLRRNGRLRDGGTRGNTRIEHVQIFQSAAGIEKHDCILRLEESRRQQPSICDQASRTFRCREDSFDLRPMTGSLDDLGVGGAHCGPFAFLQYVEDQIIAIGFGNAQA